MIRFLPRMTRRRFLALTLTGGTLLYTWRFEPHWLEVVRRELPLRDLPASLEGKTLVQVSDLHVGTTVDAGYLRGALAGISDLEPDWVVLTGDFMTYGSPAVADDVARVLEALAPARHGCAAVLGNHDYGPAWQSDTTADALVRRLEDVGVTVLRNETRTLGGLAFVGVEDLWGPHFDPQTALRQLPARQPALALCHNPDAVDLPVWETYRGWILAGHTHGGQCKPPFLPPPILPVRNRRYTAGAFDVGGGRHLYINRGLGYLRRVRFNARPEITVFRLIRDTSENA